MIRVALVAIVALLASSPAAPAQSTPARDCEIRSAYSDMQDATEVWLTLEPRTADGKPAPPGTIVTVTGRFKGKRPTGRATDVEVRANVGLLWAPRAELWLVLDAEDKVDFAPQVPLGNLNANGFDYVVATLPVATLEQIASAKRVTGSVLGLQVELTDAQREALRRFVERITSTSRSSPSPACAP